MLKRWTLKELDVLEEHLPDLQKCYTALQGMRSWWAIIAKAKELGIPLVQKGDVISVAKASVIYGYSDKTLLRACDHMGLTLAPLKLRKNRTGYPLPVGKARGLRGEDWDRVFTFLQQDIEKDAPEVVSKCLRRYRVPRRVLPAPKVLVAAHDDELPMFV